MAPSVSHEHRPVEGIFDELADSRDEMGREEAVPGTKSRK
jgi:hypothetical protein